MNPPSNGRWSDGEFGELRDFLIEKTKNAKTPLNIKQLTRDFKKKSGTSRTFKAVEHRIEKWRPKFHEIEHIDTDTKVKMIFALSAPVDDGFLKELKAQAKVVLDDHQRIIKYRKKAGGLELEGVHPIVIDNRETIKRDKRMMEFLVEKSMKVNTPVTNYAFAREFNKATEATENIHSLRNRFNLLKKKVHDLTGIDQKTKIRMLFVSSAKVPRDFLEILRKDALVKVDENNRITKYKANDGSLELEGDHSKSAKIKAGKIEKANKKPGAPESTDNDSEVELNEESDESSSDETESDSDDESHLNKTEHRMNSFRMVPMSVMDELIHELYADVVLYNEISHRSPEFVPKMFNEATRKKLDAFLKANKARRLEDVVTDRMFQKRKRAASTSGNEPPSKKIAAKESTSSSFPHDKAIKKTSIQHFAQKMSASSSDSDSEDEAHKKVSVIIQKATPKKAHSPSSSSSED